jgi:hypothetical protein
LIVWAVVRRIRRLLRFFLPQDLVILLREIIVRRQII